MRVPDPINHRFITSLLCWGKTISPSRMLPAWKDVERFAFSRAKGFKAKAVQGYNTRCAERSREIVDQCGNASARSGARRRNRPHSVACPPLANEMDCAFVNQGYLSSV